MTVTPQDVTRRYNTMKGVSDLYDQREAVQNLYLKAKASGKTPDEVEADFKAKKDAGVALPFTEDEVKKVIERLRSDG